MIHRLNIIAVFAAVVSVANNGATAFSTSTPTRQQCASSSYSELRATLKEDAMEDVTTTTSIGSRRQALTASFAAACSLLVVDSVMAADAGTTLDFSLPKYDAKMQGFGEGSEAYSSKLSSGSTSSSSSSDSPSASFTDPGANEKDKQLRSMQLAEEARQAALAKKKAEAKMREEEDRRRAAEKKAKNAERFATIFN